MSALGIIWAASLALAIWAVLAMAVLIVTRILRTWLAVTRARIKAKMTRELLQAAEGKSSDLLSLRLSRREQGILVGAGIEMLDLVRGETALRIIQLLADCGVKAVLARWMKSSNPLRRAAAAEALAHVGDHDSHLALTRALRDPDRDVRLAAAASLVSLSAAPPLGELIETLGAYATPSARMGKIFDLIFSQQPDEVLKLAVEPKFSSFMRSKAIETIAATGEFAMLPHLIALASDSDADVRTAAIRGLGRLSYPESTSVIALAFGDPAWFVRAAAAEAAGHRRLYELVPALTALLDDSVWWVRFRASEALISLDEAGRSALRRVAAQSHGRAGQAAAAALAESAVAS